MYGPLFGKVVIIGIVSALVLAVWRSGQWPRTVKTVGWLAIVAGAIGVLAAF